MTPKVRDSWRRPFYTVPEVQVLFAFRDARQVYRAATSGFLRPYARRSRRGTWCSSAAASTS